jgi:hypothetical protein
MARSRFTANPEQVDSPATTHLRKELATNPEQVDSPATTHFLTQQHFAALLRSRVIGKYSNAPNGKILQRTKQQSNVVNQKGSISF